MAPQGLGCPWREPWRATRRWMCAWMPFSMPRPSMAFRKCLLRFGPLGRCPCWCRTMMARWKPRSSRRFESSSLWYFWRKTFMPVIAWRRPLISSASSECAFWCTPILPCSPAISPASVRWSTMAPSLCWPTERKHPLCMTYSAPCSPCKLVFHDLHGVALSSSPCLLGQSVGMGAKPGGLQRFSQCAGACFSPGVTTKCRTG
mmetsp:Transcript_44316/g.105521  ORF Transcript_44316/g.105521 Transcript_44316/m.105521 type:complete len:203 (+) Transcript_44316:337-945(+)